MQHGSRKGFSGGSQKIIGVLQLAIGAARSDVEGASLGASAPSGVQGQRASGGPGKFFDFAAYF